MTIITMIRIIPTTTPMTENTIDATPMERAELGELEAWLCATTTHQSIRYDKTRLQQYTTRKSWHIAGLVYRGERKKSSCKRA